LAAIRASHSQLREDEPEPMIQDTCSHTLPASLQKCSLPWCSSRTLTLILPLDLKKSESDFKNWVTSLRQEYSRRQKWALRIDENDSSSWPTATATDAKASGAAGYSSESGRHSGTTLTDAAVRRNWSTIRATDGQHGGSNQKFGTGGIPLPAQAAQWPTPTVQDDNQSRHSLQSVQREIARRPGGADNLALRAAIWRTPTMGMVNQDRGTPESAQRVIDSGNTVNLANQTKVWRTPSASDGEGGVMEMREGEGGKYKLRDHAVNAMAQWPTPIARDEKNGSVSEATLFWNARPLNEVAIAWQKVQPSEGESLSDIAVVKTNKWQTPLVDMTKIRRRGVTREQRQAAQVEAMLPLQAEKLSFYLLSLQDPMSTNDGQKSPKTCNPQLNPRFVEWLMGLPHGWTDCEHLETESFLSWQQLHSERLQRILDCYEARLP
jgi:hypothetical protein